MKVEEVLKLKLYQDCIFDLYGTLADIRTDEEKQVLWNKMSLLYGYYGADYTPQALHESYLALVSSKERLLNADFSTENFAIENFSIEKEKNGVRYAYEAYPEISLEEVFRELYTQRGITPTEELVLHTGQMFRILSTRYIRLYPGVKEFLQELRRKGRRVFLLTNAQRIFTEYELRYLQIQEYFDGILISSDYGIKKPDERFFRLLFERYGVRPETALMIGNDLDSDITGASRVGMDTFYIHSNLSPKLSRQADADYNMLHMNWGKVQKCLLEETSG